MYMSTTGAHCTPMTSTFGALPRGTSGHQWERSRVQASRVGLTCGGGGKGGEE
jgi:hypothetical protein